MKPGEERTDILGIVGLTADNTNILRKTNVSTLALAVNKAVSGQNP